MGDLQPCPCHTVKHGKSETTRARFSSRQLEEFETYVEGPCAAAGRLHCPSREELQDALIGYLNNTEFIQSRLNFMYEKSVEELAFLGRKLAVADSLSKLYIIRDEGMNDEKTITRMELLEESLAIYARMQEVKGLQTFNRNIEVLDGFVALQSKGGMSLIAYLLYGFLLGIALRLLFLLFS